MLSEEFLSSLDPTHWRGAGESDLVRIDMMDPDWLENAYAMCVAWGFEQRTEAMLSAELADWDKVLLVPRERLQAMPPSALEICRAQIPCFRLMEQVIASRTIFDSATINGVRRR